MALGSIVVDLLLKTGSFNNDAKLAERRMKDMERTAKRAGAIIGTAIAGAMTTATYAIRQQIVAMDEMSKAALRAGMQTEHFSQLAHAANLSDVSIQDLTTSMGRLARAQSDAQRGLTTQSDAFEKMGIAFANADGSLRAGREVLMDFADAYQRTGNTPEFLAAGMQIFGRSFQNLIPLLASGRAGMEAAADEADRLGYTLSTEAGQQAEKFNDDLTRLQTAVSGVWRAVATDLLPDLIRLTEEMTRTAKEGDKVGTAADSIANTIRGIGKAAYYTVTPLLRLREVMQGVIDQAGGFGKILRGQFSEGAAEYGAGSAAIGNAFRSMALPGNQFGGVTGGVSSSAKTPAEAAAERAEAARRDAEARATAAAAAAEAAAAGSKRRAEAERELAEALREVEAAEQASMQAMMDAEARQLGWLNRIEDMEAQLAGPSAVAVLSFRRELAELNAALAVGDIGMDEFTRAAQAMGQQLGNVVAEVDTATGEMTVFADQAARNMQDAFADFLFDPFKDGAKGMADAFAEALRRMAAQAAASEIFKAIGTWASGYTGAGSGWINAIGGAISGKRASGGPTYAGGTFLVGENGPELLHMGGNSGRVTPNNQLGSLGGGTLDMKVEIINNGSPMQIDRAQTSRGPDGQAVMRVWLKGEMKRAFAGGEMDDIMASQFGTQRRGVSLG